MVTLTKFAEREGIVINVVRYSILVLPYDVVEADDADWLLLLVGDDGGLGLNPGVPPGLGQEAVLASLALPFGEHCNKRNQSATQWKISTRSLFVLRILEA